MSKKKSAYQRPKATELAARLVEPRRFLQIVVGPRQVGKSTLVQQVTDGLDVPVRYVSADEPTLRAADWIDQQWEAARLEATGRAGAVLVLDGIQRIPAWSETVKRLWDEDTRKKRPLKVVLLGSAPLLIAQGLTESLAGRFETPRLPHWSWAEMREAFGFALDEYLYFGGYPGAAPAAIRAVPPLFGPGALVHVDARTAAGHRQHHDARCWWAAMASRWKTSWVALSVSGSHDGNDTNHDGCRKRTHMTWSVIRRSAPVRASARSAPSCPRRRASSPRPATSTTACSPRD